jgi:peptide deformylase
MASCKPMALLEILKYPDPRLRTVALPVEVVSDTLRALIDDMFETMYAAPGIGLAATQVDVHERLLVLDVTEDMTAPMVFINPEILTSEGSISGDEGCLSVPDIYEAVERADKIRVRALDRDGKEFELEADGILSVCIQHEIDHLEGKLFVDYLSTLKRSRLKKKMEKERKRNQDVAANVRAI